MATLEAGDIFGEMTCMSFYPRSATVRAAEDCTVLEMLPQRPLHPAAQQEVQGDARANATATAPSTTTCAASRSSPRWPRTRPSSTGFVDFLRPRVELVRLDPGEVIFRQGDPADNFYLVRIGFVKVSQSSPGGEHVLTYLGPGRYFGEIGLLSDIPEIRALAPPGVRTATCTALDHVDLVRISGEDFREHPRPVPRRSASSSSRWPSSAWSENDAKRCSRSRTCRWATSSTRG